MGIAEEFFREGVVLIPNVLSKAGDIYLTNHQCWHCGATNLSEQTRYLMQLQYAQNWADRCFRGVA